jgi:T5SS/PEP-CTERM-associated repeat protein
MVRSHLLPAALALFTGLCLAGSLQPAWAGITWTGDVDPDDPTAWTSSTVGCVGNTGSGSVTVSGSDDLVCQWGILGHQPGAAGQVAVSGAGSTWTSHFLNVGGLGNGELDIIDGGVVTSQVGDIAEGRVTVSDNGSTWMNRAQLVVGYHYGVGELTIVNGGEVHCGQSDIGSSGEGRVTVSGAGSAWSIDGELRVAYSGIGELTIEDGGEAESNTSRIGYDSGSEGKVTVRGVGSTWTNDTMIYVGRHGSGTLDITGGGAVSSEDYVVADQTDSTGVVSVRGIDSTLTGRRFVIVGSRGNGALHIADGAKVISGRGRIAGEVGSTGTVTVDGPGSTWTNDSGLGIGGNARGTLRITGGGTVFSDGAAIRSPIGVTSTATVDGEGSSWTNGSGLEIGGVGSGTLSITNGGMVRVEEDTSVTQHSGPSAAIHFDGGTLVTGGLLCGLDDLAGTGTIHTHGLASNVDLIFDATHGLNQTFVVDENPGQNISIHLDVDGSGSMGAGYAGTGTMSISDGMVIQSLDGYIGYRPDSVGQVTVDGPGSTWTNALSLKVGTNGRGTLRITNGGAVMSNDGSIGPDGEVTVSGAGSTWTNNHSLVAGGTSAGPALTVIDGGTVVSGQGIVDSVQDAIALAVISGSDSTWSSTSDLCVGYHSAGAIVVANGGAVSNHHAILGIDIESSGAVKVSGAGSTWTSNGVLCAGLTQINPHGVGRISIADGAVVIAAEVMLSDMSLLEVEVNNDSQLTIGDGSGRIINNGIVRLVAGTRPSTGVVYKPVLAGPWTGSGAYQALGGMWNATTREFTASEIEVGNSGAAVSIDLATRQRVLITDSASGWSLGASFLAHSQSTPIEFTATSISGQILGDLQDHMDPGDSVLGGWLFTTAGEYAADDPAYLSFNIGAGHTWDDLQVWRYDGDEWSEFDAWNLTYDGTYASFMVDDLSGYAVTPIKDIWIPGDTNGDNHVDEDDAAILAAHWGQPGGWFDGDFNDDGIVNVLDAAILAANWGTNAPGEGAVPEPGALGLLLAMAACAWLRRRRLA